MTLSNMNNATNYSALPCPAVFTICLWQICTKLCQKCNHHLSNWIVCITRYVPYMHICWTLTKHWVWQSLTYKHNLLWKPPVNFFKYQHPLLSVATIEVLLFQHLTYIWKVSTCQMWPWKFWHIWWKVTRRVTRLVQGVTISEMMRDKDWNFLP